MESAVSPLALTDDELGRIEKAALAADLRGCRVELGPSLSGKSERKYLVIAPALRGRAEYAVASFKKKPDAELFVLAADNLAFLVQSLQAERAGHDARREDIECIVAVLDSRQVPKEIAPGQPYRLHGRVLAGLDGLKEKT
jgi:hypothetical protein